MSTRPNIVVHAEMQRVGDKVVYLGTAEIRFVMPDGRMEHAILDFRDHMFPTQAEAEAYARQAAVLHLRTHYRVGTQ